MFKGLSKVPFQVAKPKIEKNVGTVSNAGCHCCTAVAPAEGVKAESLTFTPPPPPLSSLHIIFHYHRRHHPSSGRSHISNVFKADKQRVSTSSVLKLHLPVRTHRSRPTAHPFTVTPPPSFVRFKCYRPNATSIWI